VRFYESLTAEFQTNREYCEYCCWFLCE